MNEYEFPVLVPNGQLPYLVKYAKYGQVSNFLFSSGDVASKTYSAIINKD